jgi:hypothetical protein
MHIETYAGPYHAADTLPAKPADNKPENSNLVDDRPAKCYSLPVNRSRCASTMQQPDGQRVRWTRAAFGVDTADDGSPIVVRAERLGPTVRFQSATTDAARAECTRSGTRVAAAMPVRDTVLRRIATPLATRSKALKVLPSVLDVQIPFPIEECQCVFHDLRPTADGTFDALAVAARHAEIARRIEALRQLGLDPVTIDHEALALWTRSLREVPPAGASEQRVLVSLHATHAVVVVGTGRRLLGGHHVRGTDPASILRALTPYRAADTPRKTRWCWTGPAAADPATVAGISTSLLGSWPGASTTHDEPATFLARALAARELVADDLPCNLRSGPFAHPAVLSREKRTSAVAAVVVLLCGLAMVAASVAAWGAGSRRERDLTAMVSRTVNRLAGYRVTARGEHAVRIARTAVDAKVEAMQPFRRQLIDSPAAVVPDVVEAAAKGGLQIETFTVTPRKVSVSGTARGWQSCDDLVMRLEKRGMRTRLDRREAREDLRVPFTLSAETPDG